MGHAQLRVLQEFFNRSFMVPMYEFSVHARVHKYGCNSNMLSYSAALDLG